LEFPTKAAFIAEGVVHVAKRLEHDSDDDWVGGWIFYLFMEDNTK
jgi:hypothetical protein